MSPFTPKSHYYRLAALIGVVLVSFLVVKSWAVPSSWVDTEGNWYRGESLVEMLQQPLAYGGNESCVECHQEQHDDVIQQAHKPLSCESCHGALSDHAREGQKVADAYVDSESSWQCLNCHDARVTKPKGFPQFNKVKIQEHKEMEEGMICITCHNAHDPKP